MEHPCPKCGAAVADGVPFCKVCRAPQIRVPGFEPSEPVALPEIPGAAEPGSTPLPPPPPIPPRQLTGVQWSQALPWAAIGGILSLFIAMPVAALLAGSSGALLALGVAFMVGGAWSVRLYSRKLNIPLTRTAVGARIGAASGGFGFLFFAIVMVAGVVYQPDEVRKAMSDAFARLPKGSYDPEMASRLLDLMKTPGGLALLVAVGLFFMFLIFVVGASIGGAWYSAWLRRRAGG